MRELSNEELNSVSGGASESPIDGVFGLLALGFFSAIGFGVTVLLGFTSIIGQAFGEKG